MMVCEIHIHQRKVHAAKYFSNNKNVHNVLFVLPMYLVYTLVCAHLLVSDYIFVTATYHFRPIHVVVLPLLFIAQLLYFC